MSADTAVEELGVSQILIARYISVWTLGIFSWEIVNNILNDYKILSEYRIRLPTVIYFMSRACCLGLLISAAIFETTPVTSCFGIEKTIDVFLSTTVIFTSLLFFLRTRAVYNENPWAVAVFGGLWLAVIGGCVTLSVSIQTVTSGPTKSCLTGQIKPAAGAGATIPLINDTFVFLAISWRLCCYSYADRTVKDGVRTFVFGNYLPLFYKTMLQDGQAYYLATVISNLITVIVLYNSSIPPLLRPVPILPNVALMNIMASRVFRNIVFGLFRDRQIPVGTLSEAGEEARPDLPLSMVL